MGARNTRPVVAKSLSPFKRFPKSAYCVLLAGVLTCAGAAGVGEQPSRPYVRAVLEPGVPAMPGDDYAVGRPIEETAGLPELRSPVAPPLPPPTGGALWTAAGPAPAHNGQVENIANNPVMGAVHCLAAHPTDSDILFLGAVNGGIWRTLNATSATPSWTPLTDQLGASAIGAIEYDPTDVTNQTLVAGFGRFSSYGSEGGARLGALRTVDHGNTWSVLAGSGGTLVDKNISGVAGRGATIVVSVNYASPFSYSNIGIFRSTDTGATFTQVSGTGGLPQGRCFDLVGHPNTPATLYAAIRDAGTSNGIYKSTDTGATWTRVSNATMNTMISDSSPTTSNVEMAVHDNTSTNAVYVCILNGGQPAGIFRSDDGGGSWTAMDLPVTHESGGDVGLNPSYKPTLGDDPGGQGAIHFSIVADPDNANIVYVGGDRQPAGYQDAGGFPNAIGANNYTGRLFRGDASQASGSQFVHLTHSDVLGATGGGTASSSAPHADSREMVFDADGNIIEGDDGGIYKRTSPLSNTGDWFSLAGNLQIAEMHSMAYDSNSNQLIGGTQDIGTVLQEAGYSGAVWTTTMQGDGGDCAVDDTTALPNSYRYRSAQYLWAFGYDVFDAAGNYVTSVYAGMSGFSSASFYSPIELNAVAQNRILIQGGDGVYESTDRAENFTNIGAGLWPGWVQYAIAYGGYSGATPNPDVAYVGSGNGLYVRSTPGSSFVAVAGAFPGASTLQVYGVVMDPADWMTAFVVDENEVFATSDMGATWSDLTGNLLNAGVFRCIEYIPSAFGDRIVVGADLGVFVALLSNPTQWSELGDNLPDAPVFDMDYDTADDVLTVSTLGRGAWALPNASNFEAGGEGQSPVTLFSEDFQSGLGGFSIANGGGIGTGLWHLSTACESASGSHTTSASLYYGHDGLCTYDLGANDGAVTSPTISLADATAPIQLSFAYFLETEAFATVDIASVYVSENGGGWTAVASNQPVGPGMTTLLDASTTWRTATVDLSAMAGSEVAVRFQFTTMDDFFNDYPGFYIDDLLVTGCVTITDLPEVWVDFDYTGDEFGTETQPFDTLDDGLAAVAPGGVIKIKPGSSTETPLIDMDVRIEAPNGGPVVIGADTRRGPVRRARKGRKASSAHPSTLP